MNQIKLSEYDFYLDIENIRDFKTSEDSTPERPKGVIYLKKPLKVGGKTKTEINVRESLLKLEALMESNKESEDTYKILSKILN